MTNPSTAPILRIIGISVVKEEEPLTLSGVLVALKGHIPVESEDRQ